MMTKYDKLKTIYDNSYNSGEKDRLNKGINADNPYNQYSIESDAWIDGFLGNYDDDHIIKIYLNRDFTFWQKICNFFR
jgi:hypothetical protein